MIPQKLFSSPIVCIIIVIFITTEKNNEKTEVVSLIFIIIFSACFNNMGEEDTGSFTISIGGGAHNEPAGRSFQYSSRATLDWDGSIDSNTLDHEITVTDNAGNQHSYQIL